MRRLVSQCQTDPELGLYLDLSKQRGLPIWHGLCHVLRGSQGALISIRNFIDNLS